MYQSLFDYAYLKEVNSIQLKLISMPRIIISSWAISVILVSHPVLVKNI